MASKHSDIALTEAVTMHVAHSCEQLTHCASRLKAIQTNALTVPLRDYFALIESFVTNARALIDFLFAQGMADDIQSSAYVSTGSAWITSTRKELEQSENKTWKRWKQASQQVSHLTMARVGKQPTDFDWPYLDIANDLHEKYRSLVAAADPKWRAALVAAWPTPPPPREFLIGVAVGEGAVRTHTPDSSLMARTC